MKFEKRRWIFLPASEVDNVKFDQVIESNKNGLRYSQDGNTTFVKYETEQTTTTRTLSTYDKDHALFGESTYIETVDTITDYKPECYDIALPLNEGEKEFNYTEVLSFLSTDDWNSQKQ